MGENLVLNMESRGYQVAVFNRTVSKVDDFIGRHPGKKLTGCHSLKELVGSLKAPRKIMMMVKASGMRVPESASEESDLDELILRTIDRTLDEIANDASKG